MKYNQTAVIDKLNSYLKKYRRKISLTHGYCHGLTLLWLYKMSQNKENWFYDLVVKIVETPPAEFDKIEIDIEKFLNHIEWLQQPEKYDPSIRQMDIDASMEIPKELPISSVFNPRQLDAILEVAIKQNKMVSLSGPDHTIGLFKREGKFHIYNSNYDEGKAKIIDSAKELRMEIIQCLFGDFDYPTKKLAITINVIGDPMVKAEREKVLKMIINSSGSVVNFCEYGLGPLYLACENHDNELVKLLLERGAPPNRPTADGRFPLLLASYSGYTNLVKLLIAHGALVDLEGREGLPLYVACKNAHEDIVKVLLDSGVTINKADRDGDTALFGAVESGKPGITKLLLESEANPLITRKDGDTAMDLAIKKKHWDMVAMMLLYVKAPHTRNLKTLKRNKKYILGAAEKLVKDKELARYEQKEISKMMRLIEEKANAQVKLTKISEPVRADSNAIIPIENDRYRNRFFSMSKEPVNKADPFAKTADQDRVEEQNVTNTIVAPHL